MRFQYFDGREVSAGDRVHLPGQKLGVIVEIILPDTENARVFHIPQGGVMIKSTKGGNLIIGYQDGSDWDDLALVED